MRDEIALLQTLTLPAGATTGARIVLDGLAGTITGYDSNNKITFLLGGGAGRSLRFSTGDANEDAMAILEAVSDNPGNALGRLIFSLFSPEMVAGHHSQIGIASRTLDGTTAPEEIFYYGDNHQFADHSGGGTAGMLLNGKPLPRGVVDEKRVTANQGGIQAVTDLTGLSITFTANPQLTYKVSGYVLGESDTANDIFILSLTDGGNTLKKQAPERIIVANSGQPIYIERSFGALTSDALSGSVTMKLRAQRNAGASTCQMDASATNPAWLRVEAIG